MRVCGFKRASTKKILDGIWTPIQLEYYPFANVDEFCIPCYRWRFLMLLRGNQPRWGNVLKNPNNLTEVFPRYYTVSSKFREYAVIILRMISRSINPQSILRSISNPGLLLDIIRGDIETNDADLIAMELVSRWLDHLDNAGVLSKYLKNKNTLFNLQVLNEDFDIYRQGSASINLVQRGQAVIGLSQQRSPDTFTWRGKRIPIYGNIPIIDLQNQELRAPIPISGNFFDPNLDLSDKVNTPGGIRLFFIDKEFHKLWILRESIAQLIDDRKVPTTIQDPISGDILFESEFNLNQYNFRDFDIILDTIDHSERLEVPSSYYTDTGQAAIIFDLLYKNYAGIVNTFQEGCPFQIGQTEGQYRCPLSERQGCGMKDRRRREFPRDKIERNVYKFVRLLRDETVFKHETLYKLTRLFPHKIFDLNQFSDFWIGEVFQDASSRWIFRSKMPGGWDLPRVREDKKYDLCLISPLCFEKGFKVSFTSTLNSNEYVISPKVTLNPWIRDDPYNQANASTKKTVDCIIGRLSIEENLYNINRQKKQLLQSIQYLESSLSETGIVARHNEILERRLSDRYKRIGMATFGSYARYV